MAESTCECKECVEEGYHCDEDVERQGVEVVDD
jgi:hypothetical protein